MPDLSKRLYAPEQMDDFGRPPEELAGALRDLRGVNRWLGGVRTLQQALRPLVEKRSFLRVLDLGAGSCDVPARLVEWADTHRTLLQIVAVDANPTVVRQARTYLDERLHPRFRPQVVVEEGDALDLDFSAGDFDVATASLFLHHFTDDDAVQLLRTMDRVAQCGLIVGDLHRHQLAYVAIRAVGKLLPVSSMFINDAPLSVQRGFTRDELNQLARKADLSRYSLRWRWAFRWVLSSISS